MHVPVLVKGFCSLKIQVASQARLDPIVGQGQVESPADRHVRLTCATFHMRSCYVGATSVHFMTLYESMRWSRLTATI